MATATRRPAAEDLEAHHLVVGVVRARWNERIVDRLVDGVRRAIESAGAGHREVAVPGAFELPFGAQALIETGTVQAVVVVGAVVRGETTHYELVSEGCAVGVMQVQLATGVPIGNGVVTVESEAQAFARSMHGGGHNVGEDAARAVIEMALLAERLRSPGDD